MLLVSLITVALLAVLAARRYQQAALNRSIERQSLPQITAPEAIEALERKRSQLAYRPRNGFLVDRPKRPDAWT